MPNGDDFYDYDHLRYTANKGLTYRQPVQTPSINAPAANPVNRQHDAHNFTSYYFDYSGNFTGLWGKFITIKGQGSNKSYRQIDSQEYLDILRKYPSAIATPSNFAINLPGADGRHLPHAGLIVQHEPEQLKRITEELFDRSKEFTIQQLPAQTAFIDHIYAEAVRLNREQGAYIVLDHKAHNLKFETVLPGEIISSTSSEFRARFGSIANGATKLLPPSRPDAIHSQVIGMLHTHYLLRRGTVSQTNSLSSSHRNAPQVRTVLGHRASTDDVNDAIENRFVNYIVDGNYIHRANQHGRTADKLSRSMDVLTDCLKEYSEMY